MYKLFLAIRYIRANRIMAFAVAGVAIGVAVMVVVTSLMGGFSRDLKERIRGMQTHYTIVPDRDTGWGGASAELLAAIRGLKAVKSAAPRLEYAAWMGIKGSRRPLRVVGIDPAIEANGELAAFFRAGDIDIAKLSGDWAAPGWELPVETGQSCALMTAREAEEAGEPAMVLATPREDLDFKAAGRFRSGLFEYDSTTVFLPIAGFARFLRLPEGSYSAIAITVDNYELRQKERFYLLLRDLLRERKLNGLVRSWEETQANFLDAVEREKALQVIILFFIVIVAAFTILSIYMMMVQFKTRDLGILRALGATKAGVLGIFVTSGMACGLAGSLLGIALGLSVATSLDNFTLHVRDVSQALGTLPSWQTWAALTCFVTAAVALMGSWRRLYDAPSWKWKAAAAAALVAGAHFHFLAAGGALTTTGLWLAISLALLAMPHAFASTLGHAGASLWLLLAGGITLAVGLTAPAPGFPGFDLFPRQVYKLDRVPVMIDPGLYGVIIVVALLVGLGSTIWPAIRAGRYNPIEVIRDE